MPITNEDCYVKDVVFLDFFDVMHMMKERGYGDVHDEMFVMFPEWSQIGNDQFWILHRHWIDEKNEAGRVLWDMICAELGLEQDIEKLAPRIAFWVSW